MFHVQGERDISLVRFQNLTLRYENRVWQLKIFILVIKNRWSLTQNVHLRKSSWGTGKLKLNLLKMILVDMSITA